MPVKTLVKTVDFDADKPARISIPRGNYVPRIELHLKADITEGAAPVWKDGGITKLIKKLTLTADGKTFFEASGRDAFVKDIFDYKRYQDITPKVEASIYIDLEDENLTEDGILSPLPSMLYNSVVLEILWGNINDVGSDLTLNSASVDIIVHEVKPAELRDAVIEELEDEGLEGAELEEALAAIFLTIGNQVTRTLEKEITQAGETEIPIEAGADGRIYEKLIIIAENNDNLDNSMIEKYTLETNEGDVVKNIPFGASQAQDVKEYQLTQKVKGTTVVDIPLDASRYTSIKLKPVIASGVTLTNARVRVLIQYTEPNEKVMQEQEA